MQIYEIYTHESSIILHLYTQIKFLLKVIDDISSLNHSISSSKSNNLCVGLVPTMGALHEGHLSLVKLASTQCDLTIVSLFLNPTQFNDKNDLTNYPSDIESDMTLLENEKCDILFVPNTAEMYPNGLITNSYELNGLDKAFEGAKRDGHFDGVCTIVHRLLKITKADKAFFGQKDFQQLAIIRQLVQTLHLSTDIIAGPTIREKDGLAMSSRNQLLSKSQRQRASIIHEVLLKAKHLYGQLTISAILNQIKEHIDTQAEMILDYVDIVHSHSLEPIKTFDYQDRAHILIAVYVGKVRLIDNLALND